MPVKDIKYHDFLTTGKYPIYNGRVALHYYELNKYSARQLETWKHENIRYLLCFRQIFPYKLYQFRRAVNEASGYCFETGIRKPVCKKCRIAKTLGKPCYNVDEYFKMMQASTFIGFANANEKWCKQLKNHCWKKLWEEYSVDTPEDQIETIYLSENTYHDSITREEIPIPDEAPGFLPDDNDLKPQFIQSQ